jgi:hypothetical protein
MLAANTVLKDLDVSGNHYGTAWGADGPGFAQMLAAGIKDNGALTKLDISNNNIEQGQALQQIAEFCSTKGVELDSHESDEDDGSGGDY